jgi:2-dehydro-3-deoxygalactonokinase
MKGELIIVDWGSTNLRAYLVDLEGNVIGKKNGTDGIGAVSVEKIIPTLNSLLEDWPEAPLLCVGMIGSKNGLVETPYIQCPVSLDSLSIAIMEITTLVTREAYIIPGISYHNSGFIDVIRGEETIAAALLSSPNTQRLCLPGTHSKWLTLDGEKILNFQTYPTGELFACLPHAPLFRHSLQPEKNINIEAFQEGINQSQRGTSLVQQLFSLRSHYVFKENWNGLSFLSGLLIGHETKHACIGDSLVLVANKNLGRLYQLAIHTVAPKTKIQVLDEKDTLVKGAINLWKKR